MEIVDTEINAAANVVQKAFNRDAKDLHNFLQQAIPFLKEVKLLDDRYENKRKQKHERYNLLHVLTKHHLEELHTKFICDLLNPKGLHDFTYRFLEALIETLQSEEILQPSLSLLTQEDFKQVIVEDEHCIPGSDKKDIYGRIDILIRFPKFVIAIENKIRHHEGKRQIKRYYDYCKTLQNDLIVLFLTLDGREATTAENESYFSISYKKHISLWLNQCLTIAIDNPLVHTGILYYKNLLESKFLTPQSPQLVMDMTELLLKPENHILIKYQLEIAACVVKIKDKLRSEFFKKVYVKIKEINKGFEPVRNVVEPVELNHIWDKEYRGFLLKDDSYTFEITDNKKVHFLIEQDWNDLYYGLVMIDYKEGKKQLGKECLTNEKTIQLQGRMKQSFDYNLGSSDEEFFAWIYYYPLQKEVSFPNDKLNYDFATRMDEIVEEFVSDIKHYLEIYKSTMDAMQAEKKESVL